MESSNDKGQVFPKRKYSIVIQTITTIYALFYAWFFILSFIPSPQGSSLADHPYTPWSIEMVFVKIFFILFMVGFYYSWKSKLISGIIYMLWCVLFLWQTIYISNLLHVSGDAVMFIPPVLIIAIILIISGLIEKRKGKTVSS